MLKEVAQRGYVSLEMFKTTGHSPGQPGLNKPPFSRELDWMTCRVFCQNVNFHF